MSGQSDLGHRVSHYLHHGGRDGVGTGLQAAVLAQQTANIHRVQEHLLAVLGWRGTREEGGGGGGQSHLYTA